LVLVVAAGEGYAFADEAGVCIDAYEKSQILRKQGKLLEAREQLSSCKRVECPELARKDCAQWFREVEETTPSVVFSITDAQGHDVTAVRVLMDGVEFLPRLDGKARPINPGIHVFRYEPADGEPSEQQVVVYEGERNRILTLSLGPATTPPGAVTAGAGSREPPPPAAYALAGLGVTGILGFVYFGAVSVRDRDHLRETCAPRCDESEVSAVRREIITANVSLGIGVAAAAFAGWMFFGSRQQNAAVVLRGQPAIGGGIGSVEARF
jgi:hypothetical protein